MTKRSALTASMLRRLRAAGCPMPTDPPNEPERDLIIEVTRPDFTVASHLRGGGTEFIFAVRITNRSYARLRLRRFLASMPWPAKLQFPTGPRIDAPEEKVYPLRSGRECRCEELLNTRLSQELEIEPSGHLEGILLAYSMFHEIPGDYMHGSTVPAEIGVVDQFERRHWAEIELLIDRPASLKPVRPAGARSTLFDGPIPEYPRWRNPPRDKIETEPGDRVVERTRPEPVPKAVGPDPADRNVEKNPKIAGSQGTIESEPSSDWPG